MKRASLVFFLGFFLILMPFLGIPSMWKRGIYIALGFVLVLVGYQLRRLAYVRGIEDSTGERKTDVYVEQVEQLFAPPDVSVNTPVAESEEPQEVPPVRPRRTRKKNV